MRNGPPTISELRNRGGAAVGGEEVSDEAVVAEVEEAGAAALGAHVGALGHHEVHEARPAPGRDEHVAGVAGAVAAGGGLVGRGEGRERRRDGGTPAAAAAAALLVVPVAAVVAVPTAAVVRAGAPRDHRTHGRDGGVAGRRGGGGPAGTRATRRGGGGARRRRGGEGRRRARVDGRPGAVLPVDVVHLPRLHQTGHTCTHTHKQYT